MKQLVVLFGSIIALTHSVFAESWTDPKTGISWGYLKIGGTIEIARVIQDGDDESRAIPLDTAGAIEIPSTVDGLPVTRIGVDAFRNCERLTSVVIPEGVNRIGDKAFQGCTALSIVEIPSSLTSIGFSAFEDCSALGHVAVSESVTVGDSAFRGCDGMRQNGMVIVNGVLYDGSRCSGAVEIPDGVTKIGYAAFSTYPYSGGDYVSPRITAIKMVSSVTNIGFGAFWGCDSLKTVEFSSNMDSIGGCAFEECKKLSEVSLPSSVKSIGRKAFHGCSGITNLIVLSENVIIDEYAFSGCIKLEKLKIPTSVTAIGSYAFSCCDALKRDGLVIVNGSLFDGSGITGNVVVPDGVKAIGASAFSYCSGLTSIKIPSSVEKIGYFAFAGCTNLEAVEMLSVLPDIDAYAFSGCEKLRANGMIIVADVLTGWSDIVGNMEIPSGIRQIGSKKYPGSTCCIPYVDDNSQITSISIPTSVERINTAFGDCSGATEFIVADGNVNYCSVNGVLFNKTRTKLISYPRNRVGGYKIPDGVTEIGDNAFSGSEKLTAISIPSSVRKIGDGAFRNCKGLSSVNIPEGVEVVGDESFENCTKISSVVIPSSASDVGEYAFACCWGLSSVIIPEGVKNLGRWVFDGCDNLSYVKLPSTLITVKGGNPFSECWKLKEVHVSIGDADRIKTLIDASYTAEGDDEAWPLTCSYKEDCDPSSIVVVLTNIVEEIVFVTNVVEQVREVEQMITVYTTNQVDVVATNYIGVADSDCTVVSEEIRSFEPNEEYLGTQKNMFNGVVFDAATNLAGLVQLSLARATTKGVRVSGYIMLADGKKQTLKSAYAVLEEGLLYLHTTIGKMGVVELLIGNDGFRGVIGEYTLVSAKTTEDAGVIKGYLTLTYFDPKTGKQKTRRITVNGTTADGVASGTLNEKGKSDKRFVTEVEMEQ